MKVGGVRQDLRYHRTTGFRVTGELHLDHHDAPGVFDGQKIRVSVSEGHLTPDDCKLGRSRQRQEVRRFLDDAVQRGFRGKASREHGAPPRCVFQPECRHRFSPAPRHQPSR